MRNHGLQCDLERCIRSVAAWNGDDASSYVRWFADESERSIVALVCRSLLAQGVQRLDCATFAAEWERAALALGRSSVFLPHHFKTDARHRYGTSMRVDAEGRRVRVVKTAYPPFVLEAGVGLRLNPVVMEAVRFVAEERRSAIVMLKNYL